MKTDSDDCYNKKTTHSDYHYVNVELYCQCLKLYSIIIIMCMVETEATVLQQLTGIQINKPDIQNCQRSCERATEKELRGKEGDWRISFF